MGNMKFLSPFSTTRRRKRKSRRQKKYRRTRRHLRGGWGEPIVLSDKKNIMKGGWGGALPPLNSI